MESEDENVTAIRGSVMVYCTECGFANEQGDAFCSQCGSPLEQPEANPAAPASPEPPAGRPGVDHTKAQANAMMGSMDNNAGNMVAASDIKLYVMLAVYDKQHAGTLATGGKPCNAIGAVLKMRCRHSRRTCPCGLPRRRRCVCV